MTFYGEFQVGDYLRYKGNYGVIDDIFDDYDGELTIKVAWYIIDEKKQRVTGTEIKYHTRDLMYHAEKVDKSAVMVELI